LLKAFISILDRYVLKVKGFQIAKIIILYSTTDNYTIKICNKIKDIIELKDNTVTLLSIDSQKIKLTEFDYIIIGASIRYGKHNKKVYKFIHENQEVLENKKNAFFSVNIVARKANKNTPETNPYLVKFLKQISWKPKNLAVFAGKLDYQKYGVFDRQMIRFIMWLTKGDTDPKSVIEYTNWEDVDKFANLICKTSDT
jgi:menaquinone-dependent protoporphyrinogen oxidase